ncbi:hypothetical protein E4T56_gene9726 [Termitomyces sp. T112]|nr:hypothetical protein E4T56_gene9726 [Termitomyces sp. T112]
MTDGVFWRVVHGGGGGFPRGPKADQVLSRIAKGGEHGAVCGEGGVFAGWSGKGGVLGSDSWEAPSLPILRGGTQQEAMWAQDALWAELEAARQREDCLANEAALGRAGILRLGWVWEHRVLLDGASAAFVPIQDGLMQGSTVQPPELQQGMAQLERLLAGHWRHNAVAPGLWWEVAVDVGEALPGLAEVLVVVQAQMEVDLGIELPGDLERE